MTTRVAFHLAILGVLVSSLAHGQTAPLPLQPASQWTLNVPVDSGGVCRPTLNPMELTFANSGSGVKLSTHSTQAQCCACIARGRSFPLGRTLNTTTDQVHLKGFFAAQRATGDQFSVASFSIALFRTGQRQYGQVYVAEKRPNNNCAVFPQTVIASGAPFDIGLDATAPNVTFDTIELNAMGYACGVTSPNSIEIRDFVLLTGAGGGAPAPTLIVPPAANVPNIPVTFNFNTANPGCQAAGTGPAMSNNTFNLNLSHVLPAPNNVTFVTGSSGWVPGQPPTTLNFAVSATDTNPAFPTANDTIQVTTNSPDQLIQALAQALNGHIKLGPPPPQTPSFDTVDVNLSSWIGWMTSHAHPKAQGTLTFVDTGQNSTAHPGAFHCGGPVQINLTINLI